MALFAARADGLAMGTKAEAEEAGGFLGAYYKALETLPREAPFEGKIPKYTDGDVEQHVRQEVEKVEEVYNGIFKEKRQWICNRLTEYLYDHGGEVNQWPNPFDGYERSYTSKYDPRRTCTATFHYFGHDFCDSSMWVGQPHPLQRKSIEPRTLEELPVYQGTTPRKRPVDRQTDALEIQFYQGYGDRLRDAREKQQKRQTELRRLEEQQRMNRGRLKSAKEKRGFAHPVRRILGVLLILLILVNFLPPLFRAATGRPQQYDAFLERVYENLQSENTAEKAVSHVLYFLQLLPGLVVLIADKLRSIGGDVYAWVTVLFCAGIVLFGICAVASFSEVISPVRDKKKRRALDVEIRNCQDKGMELEKMLLDAKRENERALAEIHAAEVSKPEWDRKFAEYKKSEEYLAAEEKDRQARDEAEEAYQAELRVYREKVELSQEWQLAWREYLIGKTYMKTIV